MVLYVNIALAYCKLERWTPVFFCYKIWLFSIQSYLRCSSVWYPPHTRVKKSKRKSLTKYTDLAQSNSRYFTSYYMQYLCLPCLPIVCGDFTTTFRNPYAPDHQVGAHFEALDKGVLVAASKSIQTFFAISTFPELRGHE